MKGSHAAKYDNPVVIQRSSFITEVITKTFCTYVMQRGILSRCNENEISYLEY